MELPELPAGWEWEDDNDDSSYVICPHGHTIEQDGRCPEGCVSILRQMGWI